jgi:hypothetical protein
MQDKAYMFDRVFNQAYHLVLADIKRNFPFFDMTVETFYETLNLSSRKYQAKHGTIDPSLQCYVAFVSSAIKNFIDHVDRISQSRESIMAMARGIDAPAFNALYSVKTTEDFNHWLDQVGPYVDSEPVKEYVEPVNLGSMFV